MGRGDVLKSIFLNYGGISYTKITDNAIGDIAWRSSNCKMYQNKVYAPNLKNSSFLFRENQIALLVNIPNIITYPDSIYN